MSIGPPEIRRRLATWPRLRWVAGAVLALLYALLSHALMTRAEDSALALLIVLGPLAVLGTAGLWSSGHKALAGACMFAGALLSILVLGGQRLSPRWLYLAQHAGVHLALAGWFGTSLRAGARPLVSVLAQQVHGSLSPDLAAYTRQVTRAWTLYFLGMAAASLLLFFFGEFRHWSLLANVLTPVFTVLMFVGEYLLRYRLHPHFERVSMVRALQAWRAYQAPIGREGGER